MSVSQDQTSDPAGSFRLWPPPRVREVDPFDFGIAGAARRRDLNPYVSRDADPTLDEHLRHERGVVLTATAGAGAGRTMYEALNRICPNAQLLVPRRPGEFDAADLQSLSLRGDVVLWLDHLGAQWGVLGPRLTSALVAWWRGSRRHWVAAVAYPDEPDVLASKEFAPLKLPTVILGTRLSQGELAAMREIYGDVPTVSSIGANPPVRQPGDDVGAGFSRVVAEVAHGFGDDEVTAAAFAAGLREHRPEYADGHLGTSTIDVTVGTRRPARDWLELVRGCYDPDEVVASDHQVLDGRLTLRALVALDSDLERQLGPETVAALDRECSLTPREPTPAEREHVRWLADEPVGLDGDELGRLGVATALHEQLKDLTAAFPGRSFLVHVDGAWGAGKSTLLRFLSESVDGWLVVPYDSWRQSRVGPPWLTLLQAVRGAVRSSRGGWMRQFWFSVRERARLVNTWQWIALPLLVACVAAAVWLGWGLTLTRWGDVVKLLGGLVPIAAAVWLFVGLIGRYVSLDSRRSARTFVETRADPMEDLAAHFGWVLRGAGRPVLLLIDDLDRCPETFVVELLDAIQKLMRDRRPDQAEVPSLLVVVAADGRWIRTSYDNTYASLAAAVNEPGATVGTLFLEKLFQLTVPVPRLSDELKAQYLADLLTEKPVRRSPDDDLEQRLKAAPAGEVLDVLASATAIERIKASPVAINRLVVEADAQRETRHALEPFAPLLDPTPRAMKRFVMAYSMLRAVRTAEGSVVGVGPLALWTIVLTRWPMLADHLQATPDAVRLFTVPAERMPASIPDQLVPLYTDPPEDLRAVMNHPAGPLTAQVIRECSGQALTPAS